MNSAEKVVELLAKSDKSDNGYKVLVKIMEFSSVNRFPHEVMDVIRDLGDQCKPEYVQALIISLDREKFDKQFEIFAERATFLLGSYQSENLAQCFVLGPILAISWLYDHSKWIPTWTEPVLRFYEQIILGTIVIPRRSLDDDYSGKLSNASSNFVKALSMNPKKFLEFLEKALQLGDILDHRPTGKQILTEVIYKKFNHESLLSRMYAVTQMLRR